MLSAFCERRYSAGVEDLLQDTYEECVNISCPIPKQSFDELIKVARKAQDEGKVKELVEEEIRHMKIQSEKDIKQKIEEQSDIYNVNNQGRISKRFDVEQRKPRPYSNTLERQTLRQMSTLIFHQIKNRKKIFKQLVEVQILQIYTEQNSSDGTLSKDAEAAPETTVSLVIAMNPWSADNVENSNYADLIVKALNPDAVKYNNDEDGRKKKQKKQKQKNKNKTSDPLEVLKTNNGAALKLSSPELERVERYEKKFFEGIVDKGHKRHSSIATFLENHSKFEKKNSRELTQSLNEYGQGKMYILYPHFDMPGKHQVHAEEQLCAITNGIKNKNWKFRVIGKKRSCITCGIRLKRSNINDYNPDFGLFFMQTLYQKDGSIGEQSPGSSTDGQLPGSSTDELYGSIHMDVLRYFLSHPSYITVKRKKHGDSSDVESITSYATESDSS